MPFWWLQRVTLRQISSELGNRVQVRNLWESMWSRWWRNERGKETQLRESECWDCVRWEKEENYADLEMCSGTLRYWISKLPRKGILFNSGVPGLPSPPGTCRDHWNALCNPDRRKTPLLILLLILQPSHPVPPKLTFQDRLNPVLPDWDL